jgi:ATP-binding cassette, subfamily B, bacterial PglK
MNSLGIVKLWKHLSRHRKKQFYLIVILMIIASLSEVVSIGIVLPFLGILTVPEEVYQTPFIQPLIQFMDITGPEQLILPLTLLFIGAVCISAAVRLLLLYAITRFSFAAGADLSISIYRRTLYQEYIVHVSRNSSEVINGIINKTSTVVQGVLSPVLILTSAIIIFTGITIALLIVNIFIAFSIFVGFGVLYWVMIRYTKDQLNKNSYIVSEQSTKMIKSLQEGLGGIRDIIINNTQEFYCKTYRKADISHRHASGNNLFIGGSPKFIMEAIGMTMIALVAYLLSKQESGLSSSIPMLGVFALAAQRLLPVLQQGYNSYSSIKGSKASFDDVLELIEQPLPEYVNQPIPKPIAFSKEIKLTNLSFRYTEDSPWVLKNVNLCLKKGSRVGFIGLTGRGKSTLLDIIMGLLPSTKGKLSIDQQILTNQNLRAWQANIAHVPQNIYLSDSTIEENIAFGVSKEQIDHQQVKKAAQQAQISDTIEELKDGYQTFVGERGIRLSGGQRQRIGIARALYSKSNVLIFDEATSALDNETERKVMKAIEDLGKGITVLIIAHRLTTLKGCDKIVKIGKNHTIQEGDYQEMIDE